MSMKKYVLMVKDECGDDFRAYGSDFLEAVHEFPAFDEDDDAMWQAFIAWENAIVERANSEWRERFGDECHLFLERKHSDMSLSEWAALGYDTTWI